MATTKRPRRIETHELLVADDTVRAPPPPAVTSVPDSIRAVRETARLRASYRRDAVGLAWRDIRCATDTLAWLCGEYDLLGQTAYPVDARVADSHAAEQCREILDTIVRTSPHVTAANAIADIARAAIDTIVRAG
jgi:hypothetical protein